MSLRLTIIVLCAAFSILSSRLPHSGWAGSGPHIDKRAKIADRIIVALCILGVVLFAVGVL